MGEGCGLMETALDDWVELMAVLLPTCLELPVLTRILR